MTPLFFDIAHSILPKLFWSNYNTEINKERQIVLTKTINFTHYVLNISNESITITEISSSQSSTLEASNHKTSLTTITNTLDDSSKLL